MRNSPSLPFVLLAAGVIHAFPFVAGRSMEYSVLRRGGEERSIVTLLPVGSLPDTGKGVNWKIGVTDSLVSGTRKDRSTQRVLTSEIYLHVEDAYMAWTTDACEVPWDPAPPQINPIPLAKRPWGARALICVGAANESYNKIQSLSSSRMVSEEHDCDMSELACMSYSKSVKYPMPEGLWSSDSGWISYQDGATGDSWVLNRIGDGPGLSGLRLWSGRDIRDVRRNDAWIFTYVLDWKRIKFGKVDSASGHDSTWIRWTAIERLGDSGVIGTWRVARRMEGRQVGRDTLVVDFDAPQAFLETRNPADLPLTVLVRSSRPPLEPSASWSHFEWSNIDVGTSYNTGKTFVRTYEYSAKGEFEKMDQERHLTGSGYGVDLADDSIATFTLQSFERSLSSSVGGPAVVSRNAAPRSIADLERMVSEGGRILSIRDLRGAHIFPARASDALHRVRGVVFYEASSPEGVRIQGRILRP